MEVVEINLRSTKIKTFDDDYLKSDINYALDNAGIIVSEYDIKILEEY